MREPASTFPLLEVTSTLGEPSASEVAARRLGKKEKGRFATVEALGPDFEIRSCNGADRAELLPAIADVDAVLESVAIDGHLRGDHHDSPLPMDATDQLGQYPLHAPRVVDPVRDERGWAFRDGPGFSRDPVNNFIASGMPNTVDYRSVNGRVDFQASAKHRFFVRWLKSSFLEGALQVRHPSAAPFVQLGVTLQANHHAARGMTESIFELTIL